MDKTLLRTSVLLVALLALAGCFDRTNTVDVKLVKSNDSGSGPDPMQDVKQLRIRFINATRCGAPDDSGVRRCQVNGGAECNSDADCGYGTKVLDKVVDVAAGALPFEQLPAGVPLRVQVTGFADAPPNGTILAHGESSTFTVPAERVDPQPAATTVVFFRQVEKFSPVNLASDPTVRTEMLARRAGHTATLLDDGRVLIAGGFDSTGVAAASLRDPAAWKYLDTAEIFDPATGEVKEVPAMNYVSRGNTPRAFHTATKLANGQVLVAGGEYTVTKNQTIQSSTLLFDPTVDDGAGGWAPQPARVARSRHVAVTEQSGKVLLYGGLSFDGTAANTPTYNQGYEWFDPEKNLITRLDTGLQAATLTGVGHAGVPLSNGKYVVIAGGSRLDTGTAGKLNKDRGIRFYQYSAGKMTEAAFKDIAYPRTYLSIAGQGTRYVITGGFQAFDPTKWWSLLPDNPYTGTDILYLQNSTPTTIQGPSLDVPRGHMCSVTLRDGRMLLVGGRGGKTTNESLSASAFFKDDGNADPALAFTFNKADSMAEARTFHTCTLLADGSVLVTGGVKDSGATFATLQSMEIFVPRPPTGD